MYKSIDTIAQQYSQFGHVTLTSEEAERYVPNLDIGGIRGRRRVHLSAPFSVVQDGYTIKGRVIYLPNTHQVNQVIIHDMEKQDEPQGAGSPNQHRHRTP